MKKYVNYRNTNINPNQILSTLSQGRNIQLNFNQIQSVINIGAPTTSKKLGNAITLIVTPNGNSVVSQINNINLIRHLVSLRNMNYDWKSWG